MHTRWLIFTISSSLFFLSQFYRVTNAVIAPQLLNDLLIDTMGLGLLSASFFYAFALTQIPIGLLLDKIGPRSMMTTLSAMGIFGAIIFSWADSMTLGVTGGFSQGTRYFDANALSGCFPGTGGLQRRVYGLYNQPPVSIGAVFFYQGKEAGVLKFTDGGNAKVH